MGKENFYSIERDGITQGALASFLTCRFKARNYLMGWSPTGSSMSMTYGNVVHAVLEYAYEDVRLKKIKTLPSKQQTCRYIDRVEKEWHREHKMPDKKSLEHLELALLIAESTLPTYFEYWHKDLKELPWLKLEAEFKIPYTISDLPKGGYKTFLRGKMDGLYARKQEWLFETKTKGQISEGDLVDMLPFEHQVNFYLYVRRILSQKLPAGVLYNIVRKTGLQQKAKESIKSYAIRCAQDIIKRPDFYFIRMEIKISEQEMNAYGMQLEGMIRDFYLWWTGQSGHYRNTGSCQTKYGRCDYLTACASGSMRGYEKRTQVFRELEGDL